MEHIGTRAGYDHAVTKWSCEGVKEELAMFRNQFSIEQAKQLCRTNDTDKYSVGILATGGCLCTLAAIRAGLFPIWGSEIHDPTNPWTKLCQDMWRDLTGVDSLGDATKIVPEMIRRPTIVKTGFPCQDHCPLGSQKGESGSKGGNPVSYTHLTLPTKA